MLVADDQDLVRTGLRLILGTLDGIEVVGEARDGREAVRLARELRPDVCLMDIRMPVLDGVEATRQLAGPGVEDPVAVFAGTGRAARPVQPVDPLTDREEQVLLTVAAARMPRSQPSCTSASAR